MEVAYYTRAVSSGQAPRLAHTVTPPIAKYRKREPARVIDEVGGERAARSTMFHYYSANRDNDRLIARCAGSDPWDQRSWDHQSRDASRDRYPPRDYIHIRNKTVKFRGEAHGLSRIITNHCDFPWRDLDAVVVGENYGELGTANGSHSVVGTLPYVRSPHNVTLPVRPDVKKGM